MALVRLWMAAGCVGTSNETATHTHSAYKRAREFLSIWTCTNTHTHSSIHMYFAVEKPSIYFMYNRGKNGVGRFSRHTKCVCFDSIVFLTTETRFCVSMYGAYVLSACYCLHLYSGGCFIYYTRSEHVFSTYFSVRVVCVALAWLGKISSKTHRTRRWVAPISLFFAKGNADIIFGCW